MYVQSVSKITHSPNIFKSKSLKLTLKLPSDISVAFKLSHFTVSDKLSLGNTVKLAKRKSQRQEFDKCSRNTTQLAI